MQNIGDRLAPRREKGGRTRAVEAGEWRNGGGNPNSNPHACFLSSDGAISRQARLGFPPSAVSSWLARKVAASRRRQPRRRDQNERKGADKVCELGNQTRADCIKWSRMDLCTDPTGQPITSYTTAIVAHAFMDNIVKLHGLPSSIISDRDPIFVSYFWMELFTAYKITLSLSTAYHS